ncbi:MAG: pyridoxal phosphate-dependent aminotransferase family protein [Anaerolineae bacterium]|nr:pyridoxal phosphate-dependent aminotransferase family protein [Anaerolineae bacterium]MDW8098559.1 pyridoxal phosphate-dependent aminotransferase family protein [Anaerolineae bacterium]
MKIESALDWRIAEVVKRVEWGKEEGLYYYLQPVEKIDGARVWVDGKPKLMFATYSYLGLLNHPKINQAARAAIEQFGTGTHGVRLLGGTLTLHRELEERIARFKGTDDAITYSSGYVTNVSTISTLVGRNDAVICDKWDHASIVDGCLLSRAEFLRFRHNDMADLERCLIKTQDKQTRLVVVDAVYSMDGDITPLPEVVELCRRYHARLMVDEAHSLGVLGKNGRGIEEHFGMEGTVDIKMGTLSKTIPAIGGYVAADRDTITYLKHTARGFVFSASLPPAICAAAIAAFEVMEEEGPALRAKLQRNVEHFISGLKALGFNTGCTQTPIIPVIVGSDENAIYMTKLLQDNGVFALPVLPPAVPVGTSRIRANVTAAHTKEDIDTALEAFAYAGRMLKLIP